MASKRLFRSVRWVVSASPMRLRLVAVVACLAPAAGVHCDSTEDSPGGADAASGVHPLKSGDGATVDAAMNGTRALASDDEDASTDDGSSPDGQPVGDDEASDAASTDEWTGSTYEAVCQIAWPQIAGYTVEGSDFVGFTVDAAGNSYVAIGFSSDNPPLDLGVPSPGYATGVAIVEVDPQCKLGWVYEYGTPATAPMPVPSGLNLAVDATSSLTVTGTFSAPMNFGAGLVDAQQATGFVLRLDPEGNVVFQYDYPGVNVWILGVDSSGTATLMFQGDECPYLDAAACEGPPADAGLLQFSVVQLDSTGTTLMEKPFPGVSAPTVPGPPVDFFSSVETAGAPTYEPLLLAPSGTLIALTPGTTGVPLYPSLQSLTLDGRVLWARPAAWDYAALGPAGVVAYTWSAEQADGPAPQLQLIAYDGGVSWSEGLGSPPQNPGSGGNWLAVDPGGSIYIAGMTATSHYVPVVEVLDPQGNLKAWRAMGAAADGNAFLVDADGNFISIAAIGSSSGQGNLPTYSLTKLAPTP